MNKRIISLIIASSISLVQSNTYCWTATGKNAESPEGSSFWSQNNQSNNKNNKKSQNNKPQNSKNYKKYFAIKKININRLTLPLITLGAITLGCLKKASQKVIEECKYAAKKYSQMSDTNKSRVKIFGGSAISLVVLYLICRYYLYENDYFSKFYTWLFGDNCKRRPGNNGAGQPNNYNNLTANEEIQRQANNPQIIIPTAPILNLNPANILYPAPMNQLNINQMPNLAAGKHLNANAGTYNNALDAYNRALAEGNIQFNRTTNTNGQNNIQAKTNIEQKNDANNAENKLENKQEASEIDPTKFEYVI